MTICSGTGGQPFNDPGAQYQRIYTDLGAITSFNEVDIFTEFPIKAYQYKIEVSDDNENWRLADDQWSNTKIGSPMVSDAKFKARYVRIILRNEKQTQGQGFGRSKFINPTSLKLLVTDIR